MLWNHPWAEALPRPIDAPMKNDRTQLGGGFFLENDKKELGGGIWAVPVLKGRLSAGGRVGPGERGGELWLHGERHLSILPSVWAEVAALGTLNNHAASGALGLQGGLGPAEVALRAERGRFLVRGKGKASEGVLLAGGFSRAFLQNSGWMGAEFQPQHWKDGEKDFGWALTNPDADGWAQSEQSVRLLIGAEAGADLALLLGVQTALESGNYKATGRIGQHASAMRLDWQNELGPVLVGIGAEGHLRNSRLGGTVEAAAEGEAGAGRWRVAATLGDRSGVKALYLVPLGH